MEEKDKLKNADKFWLIKLDLSEKMEFSKILFTYPFEKFQENMILPVVETSATIIFCQWLKIWVTLLACTIQVGRREVLPTTPRHRFCFTYMHTYTTYWLGRNLGGCLRYCLPLIQQRRAQFTGCGVQCELWRFWRNWTLSLEVQGKDYG